MQPLTLITNYKNGLYDKGSKLEFDDTSAVERGSPNVLGKRDSPHPPPPNRATKPSICGSSSQQPNNENNLNRHNIHSNGMLEHSQHQSHPAHQPAHQLPPYSIASSSATASAAASAAGAKQLLRVRRFLSTLHQFACELSPETGSSAQNLIFGLVNSSFTVEEFLQKMQDLLHYPLRPYVAPFLRGHLPLLQSELLQLARLAKQPMVQFIRQHPGFILDSVTSSAPTLPTLSRSVHNSTLPSNVFSALSAEIEQLCTESTLQHPSALSQAPMSSSQSSSVTAVSVSQSNPLKRRFSPETQSLGVHLNNASMTKNHAVSHSPPTKTAKHMPLAHHASRLPPNATSLHAQLTQARAAMLEELMANGYQSQMAQQLNLVNQQLNHQMVAQKNRLVHSAMSSLPSHHPSVSSTTTAMSHHPPSLSISGASAYFAATGPQSPNTMSYHGKSSTATALNMDRLALVERYEKELMLQPNNAHQQMMHRPGPLSTLPTTQPTASQPAVSLAASVAGTAALPPSPFIRNGIGRESCRIPTSSANTAIRQGYESFTSRSMACRREIRASPENVPRDNEDEWRNIYTMLNCIMGMMEKTVRALTILQQRSNEQTPVPASWQMTASKPNPSTNSAKSSHLPTGPILPRSSFQGQATLASVAEAPEQEATNNEEFATSSPLNLHKHPPKELISGHQDHKLELMSIDRNKMEEMINEVRRQTAEEVLAKMNHQEENNQNCWNCGRAASDTCSGCGSARYCGSFCQLKDWNTHLNVCAGAEGTTNTAATIPEEVDGSAEIDQSHENRLTPHSPAAPGSPMKENRAPAAILKPNNKIKTESDQLDKSVENSGGISSTSRIGDSKVVT